MRYGNYTWHDTKHMANIRSHQVSFFEAVTVFDDENRIESFDSDHSIDKARHAALGFSEKARLLFVVFTVRGKNIHIISARLATRKEHKEYAEEN